MNTYQVTLNVVETKTAYINALDEISAIEKIEELLAHGVDIVTEYDTDVETVIDTCRLVSKTHEDDYRGNHKEIAKQNDELYKELD